MTCGLDSCSADLFEEAKRILERRTGTVLLLIYSTIGAKRLLAVKNLFHAGAKHLTGSMACYTENTYGRNTFLCQRLRPEVFTHEQATRTCQPRRGSVVKIFLAAVCSAGNNLSHCGANALSGSRLWFACKPEKEKTSLSACLSTPGIHFWLPCAPK